MNVELPVIVIIPVAVLSSLSVNEKLPVPVVAVRLLIVRASIPPRAERSRSGHCCCPA